MAKIKVACFFWDTVYNTHNYITKPVKTVLLCTYIFNVDPSYINAFLIIYVVISFYSVRLLARNSNVGCNVVITT